MLSRRFWRVSDLPLSVAASVLGIAAGLFTLFDADTTTSKLGQSGLLVPPSHPTPQPTVGSFSIIEKVVDGVVIREIRGVALETEDLQIILEKALTPQSFGVSELEKPLEKQPFTLLPASPNGVR